MRSAPQSEHDAVKGIPLRNSAPMKMNVASGGRGRPTRAITYSREGDESEAARGLQSVAPTLPTSRYYLWNALQLATPLSDGMKAVVCALRAYGAQDGYLPELLAREGVPPVEFLEAYAKGHAILAKVEMDVRLNDSLPAIATDLTAHALDAIVPCGKCGGLGRAVVPRANPTNPNAPPHFPKCPRCHGKGKVRKSSKFKKWATEKVLLATKVIEAKGAPTVNVTNQTAVVGGQAGFFAKMLAAADEVLYPKRVGSDPIREEAEVVEAEPVHAEPPLTPHGQAPALDADPGEGFLSMLDDVVKQGEAFAKS